MRHERWLTELYERFLKSEGLPSMSADELAVEEAVVSDEQRKWLCRFCNIWDCNSPYYDGSGEWYRGYSGLYPRNT